MKLSATVQKSVLERQGTNAPDTSRKQQLGQFLTPKPIAAFMAALFENRQREVRILDAGAGGGMLTLALVERLCEEKCRPSRISVEAYEIDEAILPALKRTFECCSDKCHRHEIDFVADLKNRDFIDAASARVCGDFFSIPETPFNAAILNPPYRKINSDSSARRRLRAAGIETSNLYAGFLALTIKLLCEGGELVAICPRSFCNGPYFKPFRHQFLEVMSLRRIHVFESRSAAFYEDEVLQENVIIHAIKSQAKPKSVTISSSSGIPSGKIRERKCAYVDVVSPRDPDSFIHLVTDDSNQEVRAKMNIFSTSLGELGLDVSTGRVVDFRAQEFLMSEPSKQTVPLIYPTHFNGGTIHWPKIGGRKPNAIIENEATRNLLIPAEIYVLVKRFSSKEERRRIVACIYDPKLISAEFVGFENHLNYFHSSGRGLSIDLARGLASFLNSTMIDVYFRQFNGHTQVNATDLRSLRYPSRSLLESLGRRIGETFPPQGDLDILIEKELFNGNPR